MKKVKAQFVGLKTVEEKTEWDKVGQVLIEKTVWVDAKTKERIAEQATGLMVRADARGLRVI